MLTPKDGELISVAQESQSAKALGRPKMGGGYERATMTMAKEVKNNDALPHQDDRSEVQSLSQ